MNTNLSKDLNTLQINTITGLTADKVTPGLLSIDPTAATSSSCFNDWSPWTGSNTCPKCGSSHIEVNNCVILTTYPAQSQLRCKDCGHYFASGIFDRDSSDATDKLWTHDQSISNIPKVGDSPYAPQVGDWPCEQEPPSYPGIYIPRKDTPMGWICPKCNRCYAPHVSECLQCNTSTINITY